MESFLIELQNVQFLNLDQPPTNQLTAHQD